MSVIFSFISKYFLDSLIVIAFGIITKIGLKYFSNDRWETIKEMVLTAMLWAEETYGIGTGQEKWTKAWQKIIELLQAKGITLSEKEVPIITSLMKATVPEINQITYSALPDEAKDERVIANPDPSYKALIDKLRAKYNTENSGLN
jgi:hypothetical protein